jgi:hypothetical protein
MKLHLSAFVLAGSLALTGGVPRLGSGEIREASADVKKTESCKDWGAGINRRIHITSELSHGDFGRGYSKGSVTVRSKQCGKNFATKQSNQISIKSRLMKWNSSKATWTLCAQISDASSRSCDFDNNCSPYSSTFDIKRHWRPAEFCGAGSYQTWTRATIKLRDTWLSWRGSKWKYAVKSKTHRLPIQ